MSFFGRGLCPNVDFIPPLGERDANEKSVVDFNPNLESSPIEAVRLKTVELPEEWMSSLLRVLV